MLKPGAHYNPTLIDPKNAAYDSGGPAGIVTNYGIGNTATIAPSGPG